MKAIIVDDEPKAIELLKSYLRHYNDIELVASFRNGLVAFEYVCKEKVDLIFLDINMPHISGIALSKIIPKNAKIIFTTAYSEYAVESYEIQAIDYLLKPISLERFTKAMGKVLIEYESHEQSGQIDNISIKSSSETYKVDAKEILYLQKDGNYMTYFLIEGKILARETIRESLDKLPLTFVQTHKSYIVNTRQVSSYSKVGIYIKDHHIPISETYRRGVLAILR